ncbi:MAG TPA: T9SS type A sorting domain-containing protein, partial [Bacteroidales bacterium]|nr:T9SS type A sorting domain-containing protein [Bacteroidales bacterium]
PVASGEVYVSLWKLLITPNPSSSEINIKLVKNDDSNLKEGNRWELEIFDQSLVPKVKATNIFDQDYKINIQNWKDGMYYVVARYGKNTITGKLVVRNKY